MLFNAMMPALRREAQLLHRRCMLSERHEAEAALRVEELHLPIVATLGAKETSQNLPKSRPVANSLPPIALLLSSGLASLVARPLPRFKLTAPGEKAKHFTPK